MTGLTTVMSCTVAGLSLLSALNTQAELLRVSNYSFESPIVPPVSPYAGPEIAEWQKSDQPFWYNPSQFQDTPWAYLMGTFFNVPFPDKFIDNVDGTQAAFLFAVPEVALFQDYDSVPGTNTSPSHAFDATYKVGNSYDLTVGVIGGGGNMLPGATLQIGLYYRDTASNKVVVASTTVTNSTTLFPTNTHLVDFQVHVPPVNQNDAWAGKHIGVQLLSTAAFDLMGGYWDVDNVRLNETAPGITLTSPGVTNGQFAFSVQSPIGTRFEILANTNAAAPVSLWTSMGTFTNVNGTVLATDPANLNQRFYRARQL